jgi:hypothetical protein
VIQLGEKYHGVVLGGIVELCGAVEFIEAACEASREAGERDRPLILRKRDVGELAIH